MKKQILICCGTGCRANGSMNVVEAFRSEIEKNGADADVIPQIKTTGCNGFCENGPIVKIMPDNLVYYKVKPKDVPEILEKSVLEDQEIPRLMYKDNEGNRVRSQEENPFYAHQQKLALRHIGKIDPENIDEYIATYWNSSLASCLSGKTPEEVIEETNRIKPILGNVKAGYDLWAEQDIEGYIELGQADAQKGDYFLRVVGDSMEGAHIYDGDLVYVQSCSTVESGRIAVVMIGDEATIKKVYFKNELMILEAANPKYESKFFTMQEVEEIPVKVIGLVRFVRTDFV